MGYSVWLMLHEWNLLTPAEYVGLGNFQRFAADPLALLSLQNSAVYTVMAVPVYACIALILAMALNVGLRGESIYRTIFYLPAITPAVASAVIWTQMLHLEFGIINNFLSNFGIEPVPWLWDPKIAKPALILMGCWSVGPAMVIFLAGLQGIPETLYEAASIDGANALHRFRHITLPMLSPIVFFNLVMGMISSFQVFTAAFVMTGGGPQNATMFSVLYIYRNGFNYFRMGYAALLAWILCIIIQVFTYFQFRLGREWVYYEVG